MQTGGKFPVHELSRPCVLAYEDQSDSGISDMFFADAPHDGIIVITLDQLIHGLIAPDCPRYEHVPLMVKRLDELVHLLLVVAMV